MSKAETSARERITVNLTPKAAEALATVSEATGDTKTDTINRALQVYAFLEKVVRDGGKIYVQEKGADTLESIRFL